MTVCQPLPQTWSGVGGRGRLSREEGQPVVMGFAMETHAESLCPAAWSPLSWAGMEYSWQGGGSVLGMGWTVDIDRHPSLSRRKLGGGL